MNILAQVMIAKLKILDMATTGGEGWAMVMKQFPFCCLALGLGLVSSDIMGDLLT